VHNALVWQDTRVDQLARAYAAEGGADRFRDKTGLPLASYFSGLKLKWLLDNVAGLRERAGRGEIAFGTIDTWLLWKLTKGRSHATDHSNASRTLLYNIRAKAWDPALLRLFGVPAAVLPAVQASASRFGVTDRSAFCGAGIPITGIAGDQQAALFGQDCVRPGDMKNTYGTGCFLLQNLGPRFKVSRHGLLTTLACDAAGGPAYAFEGAVFIGGAAVQWVRDQLGLIKDAAEAEALCRGLKDNGGVHLVPAFVGLGAPHWDSRARGVLTGLTRGSGRAQVVRAAVESMAYQSDDLLTAMQKESGLKARRLRVDGGATRNGWLMQFQADLSGLGVERPANVETTAVGAARLAALGAGLPSLPSWTLGRGAKRFRSKLSNGQRRRLRAAWQLAVKQARLHG
jgi:glycerol kinase